MFDYIVCGYGNIIHLSNLLPKSEKLRKQFVDDNSFQTKDLDKTLSCYELKDTGELYVTSRHSFFDYTEEKVNEKVNFTGELNFYTSFDIKKHYWLEFWLDVNNGNFDIKTIRFLKTTI